VLQCVGLCHAMNASCVEYYSAIKRKFLSIRGINWAINRVYFEFHFLYEKSILGTHFITIIIILIIKDFTL
jgi:hypothetical protein